MGSVVLEIIGRRCHTRVAGATGQLRRNRPAAVVTRIDRTRCGEAPAVPLLSFSERNEPKAVPRAFSSVDCVPAELLLSEIMQTPAPLSSVTKIE